MNNNSYTLHVVDAEKRYVHCKVLVDITIPIAMDFTIAIDELATKHDIKRMFFDLRGVRNIAGVGENYKYAHKELRDFKRRYNIVAMLTDPDDHSHDFVETVTKNAGHTVKSFHTEQEALRWLLAD